MRLRSRWRYRSGRCLRSKSQHSGECICETHEQRAGDSLSIEAHALTLKALNVQHIGEMSKSDQQHQVGRSAVSPPSSRQREVVSACDEAMRVGSAITSVSRSSWPTASMQFGACAPCTRPCEAADGSDADHASSFHAWLIQGYYDPN